MHIEPSAESAFWGKELEKIGRITDEQKELMGAKKARTQAQRSAMEGLAEEETNSRKILAKARGGYGTGTNPTFPDQGMLQDQPRTKAYTEGGLTSPERKWWTLGGFGVWWPERQQASIGIPHANS